MLKMNLLDIKLSDKEKYILLAYADNNMNKAKTAETSFMARGSVEYHINNIYERTGYNPQNFYDLVELLYLISSEGYLYHEEAV